jgi:hypothetical protein
MGGVRLTRREALGVAGAGAVSLALPGSPLGAAPPVRGGLRPELVTVTQRGFAAWWTTDAPADTTVRIARADGRGRVRELRLARGRTIHAAEVEGLRPDTVYRYELRSGGRAVRRSGSNPGRFRTLPRLEGRRLATIAVLNDMHVGERCSGTVTEVNGRSFPPCFTATDYAFRMTRAALREAKAARLDLLVANGDLTDRGRPDEVRRALALLRGTGLPLLIMRGNHDRRFHETTACSEDGDCLPAQAFPSHPVGDHALTSLARVGRRVAVVGLDSCDPETGDGRLDHGGQLAWLDATLARLRAEGRIALVCFHHHVANQANATHPPPLFFGVTRRAAASTRCGRSARTTSLSSSTATRTATTWPATRSRRARGFSRTAPPRSTRRVGRCCACTRTGSCAPSTAPRSPSRARGRGRLPGRSGAASTTTPAGRSRAGRSCCASAAPAGGAPRRPRSSARWGCPACPSAGPASRRGSR